ncbi:DUF6223 family protein [Paenibacillus sp. GCM10023248]|uniref:DUF6223 family protein n=1 Tax=Bacillales TaxID=1385 RepID=UPI002377F631|nr:MULTISPECIES: DUF6223 family protein [Bacillales]MDD9269303.1 DUF6223 family protein [Paenibacillus sp. MAHUQ-63]MDR6880473.1 hypothetical protein [Bacillus sp. 3255]
MKVKLVSFAILSVFLLVVPTIAFAEGTGVGYGTITPGRLLTIAAALIGLCSAVAAGITLARPTGRLATGKWSSVMSIVLSLFCVLLSAFHLAVTPGGFNTGNGRAGAIIAIAIGLIGLLLAGTAWTRSLRNK